MGRRRDDFNGSFDSLVDTMTNVVGQLVLILAIMQIDIAGAIQSVQGIDPSATVEKLEKLRQSVRVTKSELDKAKAALAGGDPEKLTKELEELSLQLQAAETPNIIIKDPALDPEELRRQLQVLGERTKEAQTQLTAANVRVETLRARLSESKVVKEVPAKIVQLPNPRPAPSGLAQVLFVCKNGRVALADQDAAIKHAVEVIKRKAETAKERCDCPKAVTAFDQEEIGNEFLRLRIRVINQTPHLVIEPRADGGTTLEQMRKPSSAFRQQLATLNPNKQYARFLVWPDSYEVYLEARRFCDRAKVAAGWHPHDANAEWIISLAGHYHCDGYKPPPPPPPQPKPAKPEKPAKPAKPAAPARPTPQDTVD